MSVYERISDREMAAHTDAANDADHVHYQATEFAESDITDIKLALIERLEAMARTLRSDLTPSELMRSVSKVGKTFVDEQFALQLSLDDAIEEHVTTRVAAMYSLSPLADVARSAARQAVKHNQVRF